MVEFRSLFNLRPLLKSGAVLLVGMTVANVGAYLFNLIVGRLLGPGDFGVFISLVSLAAILTMPATALATVAAKFSATFAAVSAPDKVRGLFRLLDRAAVVLGLILLIVLIVLAVPIRSFLHLDTTVPVLVLAVSFAVSFLLPVVRGFLQGLQRFGSLALNTALEPIIKLAAAALLIRFGFGVGGALASYGIVFITLYLVGRGALQAMLRGRLTVVDQRAVLRYSVPTLVALVALSLLTSLDVILVKHYFSAYDAGLFAGLATIGKIVLFISTPLVAVMFPLIASRVSLGDRHFPILIQTFVLVTTLSLGVLALFSLFPAFSVRILFGSAYLAAAPYLPGYGLAILFLSLATVFVHYFLSIGFTRVSWALVAALGLEVGLIGQFHATIGHVITSLTVVFGLLFLGLSFGYLWLKRSQLTQLVQSQVLRTLP